MCIDGYCQVVFNVMVQFGLLLCFVDMQVWVLQDLFDVQGVGVFVEYVLCMQVVVRQMNIVFGICLVERIVIMLIEEGFLIKGFLVKGKSLNWGLQVGFICVDQYFSKWEDCDMVEICKLNLVVVKGMDGGVYIQIDLWIFW